MALVQAAQQLIDEVAALGGKAEAEVLDEVDGLGFQREIRLNPKAVDALGDDVLEALGQDERIQEMVRSNKGVRVVFVPDSRADFPHSFDLAAVLSQNSGSGSDQDG